MYCPACSNELFRQVRQGVEIDICPRCRGIWLDRGELEKLIERAAEHYGMREHGSDEYPRYQGNQGYYQGNPGGYPPVPPHQQQPYPPRKKDGFWSRLFDD